MEAWFAVVADALDTTSVRQRAWLGALLAVPVVVTCAVVVWQLVEAAPLSFHTKGTYTYDFDQYDYVARALLDGHACWIWMCRMRCVTRRIRMMWPPGSGCLPMA